MSSTTLPRARAADVHALVTTGLPELMLIVDSFFIIDYWLAHESCLNNNLSLAVSSSKRKKHSKMPPGIANAPGQRLRRALETKDLRRSGIQFPVKFAPVLQE